LANSGRKTDFFGFNVLLKIENLQVWARCFACMDFWSCDDRLQTTCGSPLFLGILFASQMAQLTITLKNTELWSGSP
jgi:predicted small integral membrane protein